LHATPLVSEEIGFLMEEDGSNNSFHDVRGSTRNPIAEARLFRVNSGSDVE